MYETRGKELRQHLRETIPDDLETNREGLHHLLTEGEPLYEWQVPNLYKNITEKFIELGLLDWREGKDPRPRFDEARKVCEEALATLGKEPFHEADLGFLAPVIGQMMEWGLPFQKEPPNDNQKLTSWLYTSRWVIAGLVDSSLWTVQPFPPAKHKFMNQCLLDYWALLTDQVAADEGMERCSRNYDKRDKMKIFEEVSSFEGGQPFNDLYVDFRLAAIMKKKGFVSGSVHDWRWD